MIVPVDKEEGEDAVGSSTSSSSTSTEKSSSAAEEEEVEEWKECGVGEVHVNKFKLHDKPAARVVRCCFDDSY